MRRVLASLAAVALAVVVIVGLASAGGGDEDPLQRTPTPGQDAELSLAGAPEPLAALHEESNELLDGGPDAFRERLAELKGYPVVVNKWASWCGPCREEFPYFQHQALERGKEIAFVGVDSMDNDADARRFLDEFPVAYPHYRDPEGDIARVFRGVPAFPATAFYDSDGEFVYVKLGAYRREADLVEDIERYAK
jgi:thiol-disulfide isomerase/thioredoxin